MNSEQEIQRKTIELRDLRTAYESLVDKDSVSAGAAFKAQGIKARIAELEVEIAQLSIRGSADVAIETFTPPNRRGYDSTNIYRLPQPELAEPIHGERNLYPNSRIGSFIYRLGPHTRLLTFVGVKSLTIPIEMRKVLTEGERLAAFVSKGSLSWSPSELERFGRDYIGLPEFFMMRVYEDARSRFPKEEPLESIDDIDHETREENLSQRLKSVPIIIRRDFRTDFLERIKDFHEAYTQAAYLDRPALTKEIYEAVTSSS